MISKTKFPEKEPIMSIGLVLPEDKQLDLEIKINGDEFDIKIDQEKLKIAQHELSVKHTPNGILVNNIECDELEIKNKSRTISNNIYLSPINAGRGFHWQKSISIQVLGNLRISSNESSLFVVNAIYLEDYLMCVATSEMSSNCPESLLESQTVAARSWILAAEEKKHKNLNLDACNDDCCQRYQGIINLNQESIKATNNTRGTVLVHEGMICDTRYSKSCGGILEANDNVWDTSPKAYLRSVYDGERSKTYDVSSDHSFGQWLKNETASYCSPKFISEQNLNNFLGSVDKEGSYYRWEVSYDNNELADIILAKTGQKFKIIKSITPIKRGGSGRILSLEINGAVDNDTNFSLVIYSEYEIRRVLHPEFLYSSAFTVESNSRQDNETIRFTLKGAGWGHGVGLCQIGALGMALDGRKTEEILLHYYQSSQMRNIYD